jgi:hypothetical protein
MKRFCRFAGYPGAIILGSPHATRRLNQAPPLVARPKPSSGAAGFGTSCWPKSQSDLGESDGRNTRGDTFEQSPSTRNTGRA